jgi:hypothetical protein
LRFVALFEPIFDALNRSGVRYVVVGGVATVLHGFPRLTADIDLVVDLEPGEAQKAINALLGIGLRPYAPVDPAEFADPSQRRRWIEEKNMRVFTMSDPHNPLRQVDIFVEHPMDFETLWSRAERVRLEATEVRVAAIPDLIELKRQAGRLQDLADIEALTAILQKKRRKDG